MAEQTEPTKWEGKLTAEFKSLTVDQVWPIVEDFCNLHKWCPDIDVCYRVEGEEGKPGLIRYFNIKFGIGEGSISWAKEKLVMIDPIEQCFSFEVIENNMGIKEYSSTWKVLPVSGDDQRMCKIEYSYICSPISGWTLKDFNSYKNSSLQNMAKKIEETMATA